jgi:eukaryotic-like serine/threonine-protein kinase
MADGSVGPYRLLDRLGAGGMGEVFLAEDSRLRRHVALKRLTGRAFADVDARNRILREARAVAKVHHPGIAAIFDVVEDAETVWIVMEYVPGETLAHRLRQGRVPLRQAIDIGVQIAEALADAHAHGVLHCDLKPSNVLLTPDGKAKLLDFGLARQPAYSSPTEETRRKSETDQVVRGLAGTAGYLPPERLSGAPADERGDIYSLGVVLFELLTGRRPFDGPDMVAIAATALTTPPPAPKHLDATIPERLSDIVVRMLASDPAARFRQASDVAAALRSAAEASDATVVLDDGVRRRPRRLHPALAATALVAVVVGGSLTIAEVWRERHEAGVATVPARPAIVVKPFANLSGDPANDYLGIGLADDLTAKLSTLPQVTMVSRAATAAYLAGHPASQTLARDLGTSYVVDGGVQRTADRLHVTVTLAGADGAVRWGSEYDGTLADLFALQHQMAEALALQVNVTLTPADRRHLTSQPTQDVDAFGDYSQGQLFLDRRDAPGSVDHAIEAFKRAIARDSQFAQAHAGLGWAYWEKYEQTKDPVWTTRAIEASLDALRLDPSQAEVHVALGRIYIGLGRSADAFEELHKALGFQPNSDDAHRLLGDLLARQGRLDEAVAEYTHAIDIRPGYWQNYNRLAIAYFNVGRFTDAATAFKRVTVLQPDSPSGFNNLGATAMYEGDLTLALESFQQAVRIAPDAPNIANTLSNLGTVDYWKGDYEAARTAYEQAVRTKPDPRYHRNLGDALQALHDTAGARAQYRLALQLATNQLKVNPKDTDTMSLAAVVEAKLGRRADALAHVAAALDLAPTSADVRYRDATIAALLGEPDRALAALKQAIAEGYSRVVAAHDLDLQGLRGRPEFDALVNGKKS